MSELTITNQAAGALREGAIALLATSAEALQAAIASPDRDRLPARTRHTLTELARTTALLDTLNWEPAPQTAPVRVEPGAHRAALSEALAATLQLLAEELATIRQPPDHTQPGELQRAFQQLLELHTLAGALQTSAHPTGHCNGPVARCGG